MKKYLGSHKVARGEDLFSIAKKYYGDASAGKYIAQANGGISKARPGSVLKLPRVTAVGEQGVEFVFDVGGEQIVAPNPEANRMMKGGFKPARGLAIGGYLGDDPYGGIDVYNPPTTTYNPPPTTTTTTTQPTTTTYEGFGTVENVDYSNVQVSGWTGATTGTTPLPTEEPTVQQPPAQTTAPQQTYTDNFAGQMVQSQGPTPFLDKSQYTQDMLIARQQQAHPSYQNALGTMMWDSETQQYILQDTQSIPELSYTPSGTELRQTAAWEQMRNQQIQEFRQADQRQYKAEQLRAGNFPEGFTAYQSLVGDQAIGVYGYGDISSAGGLKQYASMYIDLLNAFEEGGEPLMHIPNNVVGHPDFPYSAMDLLEAGYAPDPEGGAFWGYAMVGSGGGGGDGAGAGGSAGGNRRPGGYGGTGPTYDPRLGLLVNWRGVGFG